MTRILCVRDAGLVEEALLALGRLGLERDGCIDLGSSDTRVEYVLRRVLEDTLGRGILSGMALEADPTARAREILLEGRAEWVLTLPPRSGSDLWFILGLDGRRGVIRGSETAILTMALAGALYSAGWNAGFLWPDRILVDGVETVRMNVEAFVRPYNIGLLIYPLIIGERDIFLHSSLLLLVVLHLAFIGRMMFEGKAEDLVFKAARLDLARGRRVVVEVEGGLVEGVALGCDGDGRLIIETGLGRAAISSGRIVWLEGYH